MSSMPGGDDAAAAIHAAFAKPVRYTGAGLLNARVPAVRSGRTGAGFQGPTTFEVRKDALAADPAKGDTLVEKDGAGARWQVFEITSLDDVDAWRLGVELLA